MIFGFATALQTGPAAVLRVPLIAPNKLIDPNKELGRSYYYPQSSNVLVQAAGL
jgi:hypothetical protein